MKTKKKKSGRDKDGESFATFHPFPRLPIELRLAIWKMSLESRTITLLDPQNRKDYKREDDIKGLEVTCLHRYTPSILHVNYEAREVGLLFYTAEMVNIQPTTIFGTVYHAQTNPRRMYLNQDLDIGVPWVHGRGKWSTNTRLVFCDMKNIALTEKQWEKFINGNQDNVHCFFENGRCEKLILWSGKVGEKKGRKRAFTVIEDSDSDAKDHILLTSLMVAWGSQLHAAYRYLRTEEYKLCAKFGTVGIRGPQSKSAAMTWLQSKLDRFKR